MPRTPLSEAARSLGLHPLNLLIKLRPHVLDLSECWPTVDEGLIDTIRHLDGHVVHVAPVKGAPAKVDLAPAQASPGDGYSPAERKIIEKLWRNAKWAKLAVNSVSLHKMCQEFEPDELDTALDDLLTKGLVLAEGNRGPWSLNSGRKADIEKIALSVVNSETGIRKAR